MTIEKPDSASVLAYRLKNVINESAICSFVCCDYAATGKRFTSLLLYSVAAKRLTLTATMAANRDLPGLRRVGVTILAARDRVRPMCPAVARTMRDVV